MAKKSQKKKIGFSDKRVLTENDSKRVSRGKDMYGYGEQKKALNLSLTPTAIKKINDAANSKGKSKSEFIERWARKEL